jgi:hypothetical protein
MEACSKGLIADRIYEPAVVTVIVARRLALTGLQREEKQDLDLLMLHRHMLPGYARAMKA